MVRWCMRLTRWCIRLTRLTLVCEVIKYRLVQVRQNHKKKRLFVLAARNRLSLFLPLSFSHSSYFLSFSIQKCSDIVSFGITVRFRIFTWTYQEQSKISEVVTLALSSFAFLQGGWRDILASFLTPTSQKIASSIWKQSVTDMEVD